MSETELAIRRIVDELFNTPDAHRASEFYAEDCRMYDPAYPPEAQGAAALAAMLAGQRQAMPDLRYVLDDVIPAGDRVAIRWTVTGTASGSLLGFAPTNRQVSVTGLAILRFEDGKVKEVWQHWDMQGFQKQMAG